MTFLEMQMRRKWSGMLKNEIWMGSLVMEKDLEEVK